MQKSQQIQNNYKNNINIIAKLEKQEDFTEDEKERLKNYSGQNSHPLSKDFNTEYYSPDIVTKFIIDVLNVNNIKESKTLCDLSCGIGNMFKFINNKNIQCYGYELENISSRIAQILYPNAKIKQCNTIENIDNMPQFDYIIGNPPFSVKNKILYDCEWGNDKKGKLKKQTIESIFLDIAIKKCKQGGYVGLIVPDGLLSNSGYKSLRTYIFKECKLLSVISLPSETFYFSGLSGTGAKTSIIFLQKLKNNEREYKTNDNDCVMSKYQPSILMACVDEGGLGWNNKGNPTNKNDLEIILKAYKEGVKDEEI